MCVKLNVNSLIWTGTPNCSSNLPSLALFSLFWMETDKILQLFFFLFKHKKTHFLFYFPLFTVKRSRVRTVFSCIINPPHRLCSGRESSLSLERYGFKSTGLTMKIEFYCLPVSHSALGVEWGGLLFTVVVAHHSLKISIV